MLPITIILTEGYSDWEIGVLAGTGRAFYDADISFVSPDGEAVTSVAGLKVTGLARFEAPREGVVVVCGGAALEGATPPALEARLREAHNNGCVVAGICGGTLALARAGLLDDVRHTSNAPDYLGSAPEYGGAAHYVDQPSALRDERIITAPAPAPASFAMEVLIGAGLEQEAAGMVMAMLGQEHSAQMGS